MLIPRTKTQLCFSTTVQSVVSLNDESTYQLSTPQSEVHNEVNDNADNLSSTTLIYSIILFEFSSLPPYTTVPSDKRQATSDKRQATSDKRQATSDKRQATSDKRQATSDKRQATSDKRQATSDKRHFISEMTSQSLVMTSGSLVTFHLSFLFFTTGSRRVSQRHPPPRKK